LGAQRRASSITSTARSESDALKASPVFILDRGTTHVRKSNSSKTTPRPLGDLR
jgi:hypothetical protein